MTERVIGPTGGRRRKRMALLVPFLGICALILAIGASAGPVSNQAVFEGDDGNLAPNASGLNFDWNSFSPTTWTGTAPLRSSSKTTNGWRFGGKEDAEDTTSDTGFAGGTKQDDNCASVISAKAPNKDDLKRFYLASKDVGGDTFLALAWVRITQNTTSPSAHVGFEFNQGSVACAGGSGLVNRVAGDMLVVYDFEGGSGDLPTLTLRRWVTSGSCEVGGSVSPPCWGPAVNLTASGFAEARVNTAVVGSVSDTIGPLSPTSETLGVNEFGEAIINLTDAGVFGPGACASFGLASAISRSSGSSGSAQMKDLAGPLNFQLQNCGSITIIKQTDPRGLNQNFSFTSTIPTPSGSNQVQCTSDSTPASFTLNDTGNAGKTLGSTLPADNSAGNTESCINIAAGTYTVNESASDPAGFAFDSLTCTDAGGNSTTKSGRQASITVAGGGSTVCVYINKQQLGALKILKKSTKGTNPLVSQAGAVFGVEGPAAGTGDDFSVTDDTNAAAPDEDADVGEVCVSGLVTGTYTINETTPPPGYGDASQTDLVATVVAGTNCGANLPGAGATVSFLNPPLYDLQVNFNDDGSGETSATISCSPLEPPDSTTAPTGWDTSKTYNNREAPESITCTIEVDP